MKPFLNRRDLLKLGMAGTASSFWMAGGCRSTTNISNDSEPIAVVDAVDNVERNENLVIAYPTLPSQFDPALTLRGVDFQICFTLFDGLVWVDHTLTPQPMLAKTWEHTENLLTWTFSLRQGVKYHHGTELTARDVVYSFQRILAQFSTSPLKSVLDFLERVEAVDDYTVNFHLHYPNVELPMLLGAAQARIVAHDYEDERIRLDPSGTGPFMLEEIVRGQQLIFTPNPEYWGNDRPELQPGQLETGIAKLHFVQIPDEQEQMTALLNGEVDLLPDVGYEWLDQVRDSSELVILETASGSYHTLVMRVDAVPFTDIRVRQAFKYCLNRATLQQRVLQGHGELGTDHPIPSVSPFWADLTPPQHNIAAAKELLADAGYPDGFQLDLITSTVMPGMSELARAIQEQVAQIGVVIEIVEVPADIYWDNYWANAPCHISGWTFRVSIDETLFLGYHSLSAWNESGWSSTRLDTIIEEARQEADAEQRKLLYQEAQQLIMEEGGVVIPYFRPMVIVMHQRLQGIVPHPAGWLNLEDVKFE